MAESINGADVPSTVFPNTQRGADAALESAKDDRKQREATVLTTEGITEARRCLESGDADALSDFERLYGQSAPAYMQAFSQSTTLPIKSGTVFSDNAAELGEAWAQLCEAEDVLARRIRELGINVAVVRGADAWFLEPQDDALVLMHANVSGPAQEFSEAESRFDLGLDWVDRSAVELDHYTQSVLIAVDEFAMLPKRGVAQDREFAFDVPLTAAIRVKAASLEDALDMLNSALDSASCNAGAWPNGDPILFEASTSSDPALFEVDGLQVEAEAVTAPVPRKNDAFMQLQSAMAAARESGLLAELEASGPSGWVVGLTERLKTYEQGQEFDTPEPPQFGR